MHNLDVILLLFLKAIWFEAKKISLKFQGVLTFSC